MRPAASTSPEAAASFVPAPSSFPSAHVAVSAISTPSSGGSTRPTTRTPSLPLNGCSGSGHAPVCAVQSHRQHSGERTLVMCMAGNFHPCPHTPKRHDTTLVCIVFAFPSPNARNGQCAHWGGDELTAGRKVEAAACDAHTCAGIEGHSDRQGVHKLAIWCQDEMTMEDGGWCQLECGWAVQKCEVCFAQCIGERGGEKQEHDMPCCDLKVVVPWTLRPFEAAVIVSAEHIFGSRATPFTTALYRTKKSTKKGEEGARRGKRRKKMHSVRGCNSPAQRQAAAVLLPSVCTRTSDNSMQDSAVPTSPVL